MLIEFNNRWQSKIWQIDPTKVDSMYYRFEILSSDFRPLGLKCVKLIPLDM
jgi:hypothetical protein